MSKKIIITGKRNIEAIASNKDKKRANSKKWNKLEYFKDMDMKKQWTLDRLDNDQGHNRDNVVICCLECNLKKGTMDDEKFRFAKQMRIIKKY